MTLGSSLRFGKQSSAKEANVDKWKSVGFPYFKELWKREGLSGKMVNQHGCCGIFRNCIIKQRRR